MRSLIRPSLFVVARLGLFLTLAAWLVGQSFVIFITVPAASGSIVTSVCPEGWIMGYKSGESVWSAAGISRHFWRELDRMQAIFDPPPNLEWRGQLRREDGVLKPVLKRSSWASRLQFVEYGSKQASGSTGAIFRGPGLAFPHSRITLTLLACNGLLLFVYRKRADAEPCED